MSMRGVFFTRYLDKGKGASATRKDKRAPKSKCSELFLGESCTSSVFIPLKEAVSLLTLSRKHMYCLNYILLSDCVIVTIFIGC